MRIIQVNLQPDFGGAERHVLLLARGLAALSSRHEILVACHPAGRLRRDAENAGFSTLPLRARNQVDPAAALRFAFRLRRLRPDVLHLHTPRDYVAGALAARLARVPVLVLTRHMLRPVKPLMRSTYNRAGAVVCLNEAVRANLAREGVQARRLVLVPGAVDTDEFSPELGRTAVRAEWGLEENDVAAGIVGRLVAGKGHAFFLDAAARLRNEPFLTFVIVGDGPEQATLKTRARQLGLEDEKARFAGFRTDVPAVMAALDIVVLAATDAEVMPLTLLEAMAACRPTVATNVGGVGEIVEDNATGLLVPPGDAGVLAEAVRVLARDGERRARLGAAGRNRVERRFSLPAMAAATERLYDTLRAGGTA